MRFGKVNIPAGVETKIVGTGMDIFYLSRLSDAELMKALDVPEAKFPEKARTDFRRLMKLLGIDAEALTEGWDEKEKDAFYMVLNLWLHSVDDMADALVFTVMLKHFLIPTMEKKKALEQMITALGKKEDTEK